MAYLTPEQYRDRSLLPSSSLDELLSSNANWVTNVLENQSGVIDSRLAKRYSTPFASPVPVQILEWLTRLVDARAYLKLGIDPNDAQISWMLEDSANVQKELQEAADSLNGLYQLPLTADNNNAISQPKILSSSQASPYSWISQQASRAQNDKR